MKKIYFSFYVLLILFACGDSADKNEVKNTQFSNKIINGSYTDDNGNKYKTVTYSDGLKTPVTWMADNLNVVTFRNGDSLFFVQDVDDWVTACEEKLPACFYFEFDEANKSRGKYYNYFALTDPRGLAPSGWHVSSSYDWIKLWDSIVPKQPDYEDGSFGPINYNNGNTMYCKDPNWAMFVNPSKTSDQNFKVYTSGTDVVGFNSSKLNLTMNGRVKEHSYAQRKYDLKYRDNPDHWSFKESFGQYWLSDGDGFVDGTRNQNNRVRTVIIESRGISQAVQGIGLQKPGLNVRCVKD